MDYRALAEFRYRIRLFLHRSEEAARRAGLEPQQHQLLLALRGLPEAEPPTIKRLAERLQLRHHTTVGLVDRLEARGLIARHRDPADQRCVFLEVTPPGAALLQDLSLAHQEELRASGPLLIAALDAVLKNAAVEH